MVWNDEFTRSFATAAKHRRSKEDASGRDKPTVRMKPTHISSDKREYALVKYIDNLLTHRPCPWQGPGSRPVLERLVHGQPHAREDEVDEWAAHTVYAHRRASDRNKGALRLLDNEECGEAEDVPVRSA
jgi:hypothetical protein